jgi:amino acid transporter
MVDTLLAGMVPILLTAISYGRMAALYPAAGSAYDYVGRGLNPHAGFLAGWAMFLCYLAFPIINVIYVAVAIQREFPRIPYALGALGFAALITFLNLRGIRWTARTNEMLLAFMCAVIMLFIVLAVWFLLHSAGPGALVSTRPFYNPQTFSVRALAIATSFAALTYMGWDGVSTLAEDVRDPRRNILLALVITVLFTAIFSGLQVYLAQLVMPEYRAFASPETAFMDVCHRVGGMLLYHAIWLILVVASFGSGLTGQVGAARILFGMGRDNVLPRQFFAHVDARRSTPSHSVWTIGVLALIVALLLNRGGRGFELGAEILNCGALVAFIGVNLATFWQFWIRGVPGRRRNFFVDLAAPWLGLVSCLAIWLSLPRTAIILGGGFLALGFAIAAAKTRGFRTRPIMIDFHEA